MVFELNNFGFTYKNAESPALKSISLTVKKGELITLCGLSGSGKSTLLQCMKGCFSGEKSGSIRLFGKEISNTVSPEIIGYVTQNPRAQVVTDKVWHELAFAAESVGIPKSEQRIRIAKAAVFFGIEALMDRSAHELSGGQLQLVNLAAATVLQPEILLLDEPLSQLDFVAAGEFTALLSKMNRELGITVICAEHNLPLIMPISTRVIALSDGEIISDGTPSEVCRALCKAAHPLLYSMSAGIRLSAALNRGDFPMDINSAREIYRDAICENHFTPIKSFPPESKEIAIKIRDLNFNYKGGGLVLQNLNLDIYKNTVHFLLGGNGCGKTTLLKLICGEEKAIGGKIGIYGKIAYLPQEPLSLFYKDTLYEELSEVISENADMEKIIRLCKAEHLLYRNPARLSGGEIQRAAIAKLLCTSPDILLLDEPTKSLDSRSKLMFSDIISDIKKVCTVVIVTHDTEFCAENADFCSFIFDKSVSVTDTPEGFFKGGMFFTTDAARISRGSEIEVITTEELLYTCTGKRREAITADIFGEKEKTDGKRKSPIPLYRKICIGAGLCFTVGVMLFFSGIFGEIKTDLPLLPYLLMLIPAVLLFIGIAPKNKLAAGCCKPKKARDIIAAVTLAVMTITVIAGNFLPFSRKYLIISVLLLMECLVPFMLSFESKRVDAGRIALLSIMCAASIASRELFFMLPQFKPVAAIVIITAVAMGAESGFIAGAVTMLVSNLMFGQGAWTPWQMLAMGLVGFFAGLIFRKRRSVIGISVYGFLSVLIIYGGIMNLSQLLIYDSNPNFEMIAAYLSAGLVFDLIHAGATVIFLLLLTSPLLGKLQRAADKLPQ